MAWLARWTRRDAELCSVCDGRAGRSAGECLGGRVNLGFIYFGYTGTVKLSSNL